MGWSTSDSKHNCDMCGKPTKKYYDCGCNPGLHFKTSYMMRCSCGHYCSEKCLKKRHEQIAAYEAGQAALNEMLWGPRDKCVTCDGTGKVKGYRCCECNGTGKR